MYYGKGVLISVTEESILITSFNNNKEEIAIISAKSITTCARMYTHKHYKYKGQFNIQYNTQ